MTLMAAIIVFCLSPSQAGRQVRPRLFAGGQAEALRVAYWSGGMGVRMKTQPPSSWSALPTVHMSPNQHRD